MLIVDTDKIAQALDYPRLVEALREGHRRGVDAVERVLMSEATSPASPHYFTALPAWRHGEALGT
ncbi:MAG: hypothetical protein JO255_04350, partial [Alphaproteobacteria bacterium]|nr:hypothetical protein [Alphaproteobacteria bacterium]